MRSCPLPVTRHTPGTILGAMLLASAISGHGEVYYNLLSPGVAIGVNGAIIFTQTAPASSSGSGTFGSYLKILGNTPVIEGLSTSDNGTLFADTQAVPTQALSMLSLPGAEVTFVGGGPTTYYAFALDLNEPNNGDSFLSVDTVKIYSHPNPNRLAPDPATFTGATGGAPTLVWDMDGAGPVAILTDVSLAGSGDPDIVFAVPTSLFASIPSSDYLFIQYAEGTFGVSGGKDFGNAGGFEEFGLQSGSVSFDVTELPIVNPIDSSVPVGEQPPSEVPEPGTWLGALATLGLLGSGMARRLRAQGSR